jgi:hypothetical protein
MFFHIKFKKCRIYSVEHIVYYFGFLRVIHDSRVRSYVLLTRLPWSHRASYDVLNLQLTTHNKQHDFLVVGCRFLVVSRASHKV